MKIFKILFFPIKCIMMFFIYVYKWCISPLLPHTCRFYPSCSTYFLVSLERFGIFKGSCLGIRRILKCTPHSKMCGFDPVPQNIKGDSKWII